MKKPGLLLLVIFAVQILGFQLINKSAAIEGFDGFVFGVGNYFEITNSPYVNITLSSTEVVRALLKSRPGMVIFGIESNCSATSTILTFDGFEASKMYYRLQDSYLVENFTTDPSGKYTYTQDISGFHQITIQEELSTVTIRSDGTVSPATAPISVDGDIYTFTDNILDSMTVLKNNIVVDGDGYTLDAPPFRDGLTLSGRSNVTVKNVVITGCDAGIYASGAHDLEIRGNVISDNSEAGILLWQSDSNVIAENEIRRNYYGIGIWWASDHNVVMCNDVSDSWWVAGVYILYNCVGNQFYHNNIVDNVSPQVLVSMASAHDNVWDDGYPSGGNYWSDYTGIDNKCGPDQDQDGRDAIGDTPYMNAYVYGEDHYPLMSPWTADSSKESAVATRAGQSYPILLVSNSTISDIKVTPNKLDFTVAGEEGTSGYVKAMIPVGLNTTEIKVFVNNTKLKPPPYPIIVTNNTHYFIYFALDFTSTYEVSIFFVPITATVNINPNVLNLKSEGEWITSYLELPDGYDVADIDRITVLLNDTIPVDSAWIDKPIESVVGDYDSDGTPDLMVKFDRTAVIDFIMANAEFEKQDGHKYAYVTLAITGTLYNGIPFEGSDTIKAIIYGCGAKTIDLSLK